MIIIIMIEYQVIVSLLRPSKTKGDSILAVEMGLGFDL